MQPEVGLAGPGAPKLGAREILAVPCAPTGAAQVSVVPSVSVSVFVRCSKGVDKFGRDVDDVGGVEWLRREHHVVVLVRRVEYGARWSQHCECVAELV